MKNVLALFFLTLIGCTSISTQTDSNFKVGRNVAQATIPDLLIYNSTIETEHFKVFQIKQDAPLTQDELKALTQNLESGFQKVFDYLGADKSPSIKLVVLLEGNSFLPGQPPRYPSVDSGATIRLFRFMGPGAAYLQGLPHELVHAFRNKQIVLHEDQLGDTLKGYGFVEEAFAEYVATIVDPTNISFPRYGFPLDIVTGYWISTGQDIPLPVLFNHHEINPKCITQAYPLRASFFKYLNEVYGKDKLLLLVYSEKPYSINIFDSIYAKSFDDLATEWKKWAQLQFDHFPDKDQILESYKSKTPLKYLPVCKSGQDW